jgi:hypothetical protein
VPSSSLIHIPAEVLALGVDSDGELLGVWAPDADGDDDTELLALLLGEVEGVPADGESLGLAVTDEEGDESVSFSNPVPSSFSQRSPSSSLMIPSSNPRNTRSSFSVSFLR